jgi:hypothetical protein
MATGGTGGKLALALGAVLAARQPGRIPKDEGSGQASLGWRIARENEQCGG